MWLEFLGLVVWILGGLNAGVQWMATRVGNEYRNPLVLAIQTWVAYGLSIFLAIKIEQCSTFMITVIVLQGMLSLLVFTMVIDDRIYIAVRNVLRRWVTTFEGAHLLVRSMGFIFVLRSFVYLCNDIEKNERLRILPIAFLLTGHLFTVTVSKLFLTDDLFGFADSLMAISIYMWVDMPRENLEKFVIKTFGEHHKDGLVNHFWMIFYALCFLLQLFKNSEIQVVVPLEAEAAPADQHHQAEIEMASADQHGL